MAHRRLLNDWDDDSDHWDDSVASASRAVNIGVGIIIAIVVGVIVFIIVSVLVCIYCVCKKRTFSSGTVVQQRGPAQQVTTYNFPQQPGVVPPHQPGMVPHQPGMVPHQPGMVPPQPVPPQGYAGQGYSAYPPAPGPAQPYPPMSAAGWTQPAPGVASPPPPYSAQPAPMGFSEKQMASAPPME